MPDKGARPKIVLSPEARRDIHETLRWSEIKFGRAAASRYATPGVRVWHLRASRAAASSVFGIVHDPRHIVFYRRRDGRSIDILRILHEGRDVQRLVPSG